MTTHVLGDTGTLTGRSLRHIVRSPDTIITTAVTPIALMLLFVYVLGGAINTGSDESYIDYMLPGILLITIASGIAYTAYRLFGDLQGGIFERFQSMPIARPSVLWAHVLTSLAANAVSVTIVIGVALLMGFRTGASPAAWIAVIAVIAGLSAKTADGASAFSYPLTFLPFISSAFVPTDTMSGPVAWFAENQGSRDEVSARRADRPPAGTAAPTTVSAGAVQAQFTRTDRHSWPCRRRRSPLRSRAWHVPDWSPARDESRQEQCDAPSWWTGWPGRPARPASCCPRIRRS